MRKFILIILIVFILILPLVLINCKEQENVMAEQWLLSVPAAANIEQNQQRQKTIKTLWEQTQADYLNIAKHQNINELKGKLKINLLPLIQWFTPYEWKWKCEELNNKVEDHKNCIHWRALHQSLDRWIKFANYFYHKNFNTTTKKIESKDHSKVAVRPSFLGEKDGNIFEFMQKSREQLEKRKNNQKLEPMKFEWTNWMTCELMNDWVEAEREYERLLKKLGPEQIFYSIKEFENDINFVYSVEEVLIGKKVKFAKHDVLLSTVITAENLNVAMGGQKRGGWNLVPPEKPIKTKDEKEVKQIGNGGELKKEKEMPKIDVKEEKKVGNGVEVKKEEIIADLKKEELKKDEEKPKINEKFKIMEMNPVDGIANKSDKKEMGKDLKEEKKLGEELGNKELLIVEKGKEKLKLEGGIKENKMEINGNIKRNLDEKKNGNDERKEEKIVQKLQSLEKEKVGMEKKTDKNLNLKKSNENMVDDEKKLEILEGIGHNENGRNKEEKESEIKELGRNKLPFKSRGKIEEMKSVIKIGEEDKKEHLKKEFPVLSEKAKAHRKFRERLKIAGDAKKARHTKSFSNLEQLKNDREMVSPTIKDFKKTYSNPNLKEIEMKVNKNREIEMNLSKKEVNSTKMKVDLPKTEENLTKTKVDSPKKEMDSLKTEVALPKTIVDSPKTEVDSTKTKVVLPKTNVVSPKTEMNLQKKVHLPKTKVELPKTEENLTKAELPKTEENLTKTKAELPKTEENLTKTKVELPKTEENLTKTKAELPKTEVNLTKNKAELPKMEANSANKWKNEKVEKEKEIMEKIVKNEVKLLKKYIDFDKKEDNNLAIIEFVLSKIKSQSAKSQQCPMAEGIIEKIKGLPWRMWNGNKQQKWMEQWRKVCPGWKELRPKFLDWLKLLLDWLKLKLLSSTNSDEAIFSKNSDKQLMEKGENDDENMIQLLNGFNEILNKEHTELVAPKWEEMKESEILTHYLGNGRGQNHLENDGKTHVLKKTILEQQDLIPQKREQNIQNGNKNAHHQNVNPHKKFEEENKKKEFEKVPSKKAESGKKSWTSSLNSLASRGIAKMPSKKHLSGKKSSSSLNRVIGWIRPNIF